MGQEWKKKSLIRISLHCFLLICNWKYCSWPLDGVKYHKKLLWYLLPSSDQMQYFLFWINEKHSSSTGNFDCFGLSLCKLLYFFRSVLDLNICLEKKKCVLTSWWQHELTFPQSVHIYAPLFQRCLFCSLICFALFYILYKVL